MISSMRGGGSERQTLLLLKHLDREQFEPHLYLLDASGDLLEQVPSDVSIHSYQSSIRGGFYYPGRIYRDQIRHLTNVIGQQAIDVIYDRTFHMTMVAGPAAGALGLPRVSTIVSPPSRSVPMLEKNFLWLKRRRLSRAYHESAAVIAVSDQAAQSAARYYRLAAQRIEVIGNPVVIPSELDHFQHVDRPDKSDLLTLVCVGRMTEEKGHSDLIAALKQHEQNPSAPPLCVWMIGDGPLRSELEQAASVLQRHRVTFHGQKSDVQAWIQAADGLILPSLFEGMPNVVIEAMAMKIPVIATRAGGTIELQRDQPTMFLADTANPESLCHAINDFCLRSDTRKQHVAAAWKLVNEHHNVQAATRRIESIFRSVV